MRGDEPEVLFSYIVPAKVAEHYRGVRRGFVAMHEKRKAEIDHSESESRGLETYVALEGEVEEVHTDDHVVVVTEEHIEGT